MAAVAAVFLAIAALAYAGFAAGRFFVRTRFPDIPLLLGLGLVLGPLNRMAVSRGLGSKSLATALDPGVLQAAAPYIAALALVVLLFDSGMQLDFTAFRRSLGPSFLHTLPIFVLTIIAVAALGHFVLGMPMLVAAALAIALVNVDQAVSSGVLTQMRISSDLRAVYFVEMALYDLMSIPLLVSLLQFAQGVEGSVALGPFLRSFTGLLSISLLVGLAGGIPWMFALRGLKGHANSYMLTFATTLGVYGASEFLGGSGALSILLFGLLVGNRAALLKRFARLRDVDAEHEKVQAFHDEITFLVRTLYFLYLGIVFTVDRNTNWPVQLPLPGAERLGQGLVIFLLCSVLIVASLIIARYLPVRAMAIGKPERRALFPVFGRGLDTAVLATLPFLAVGYKEGSAYFDLFSPWQPVFVNLSLLAILLTVLASSLFVYLFERDNDGKGADEEKPKAKKS